MATKKSKKTQRSAKRSARQEARSSRKELRKELKDEKQAIKKKKKRTKKKGRKTAKATRKAARDSAREVKGSTRGGSKREKKAGRKKAKSIRKTGRKAARSTKKTARKQARSTAKKSRGSVRDKRKTGKVAIREEKRKAIKSARRGWENWLHDYRTVARRVSPPGTLRELREIVEAALREGVRLKVVASGHSHSNATQPSAGQWYVDISQLSGRIDHTKEAATWRRRPESAVARVKAGTRVQELTSQILAPDNYGVLNMGSFDGQTVSGVVNTDTHGTGAGLGGFGDMVLSVDILVVVPDENLKPHVELWRLEPSDGLSDPSKVGLLRQRGIDRLVQDDDLFHAMVVGFGSMGIAYSYLLEVTPFYWLTEKVRISTVNGLGKLMATRSGQELPTFLSDNRHAWAFVNAAWAQVDNANPKKGDPKDFGHIPVRIVTQNKVRPKAIPRNFNHKLHPIWPPMRHRDDIIETVGKYFGTKFFLVNSGKESKRKAARGIDRFFIEDTQPPFLHTGDQSAYYRVLRRTRDNSLQRARTARSKWDNTRIEKAPTPPTLALSMDVSVPHAHLMKTLKRALKEYKAKTVRLNVPIGIRFSAPSRHMLAASYGRTSAFLELAGTVENRSKRERDLRRYRRTFDLIGAALLETTPQARPHLGKHHGLNHDRLLRTYPRAADWLEIQSHMNSSGIWSAPFTKSLGASKYRKSRRATRQWLVDRLGG